MKRLGGAYTGSYRQEDGRILFDFAADGVGSALGGPDALGTLNGDSLEVRYSFEMRSAPISRTLFTNALSELRSCGDGLTAAPHLDHLGSEQRI
jgi:hypothetical protein